MTQIKKVYSRIYHRNTLGKKIPTTVSDLCETPKHCIQVYCSYMESKDEFNLVTSYDTNIFYLFYFVLLYEMSKHVKKTFFYERPGIKYINKTKSAHSCRVEDSYCRSLEITEGVILFHCPDQAADAYVPFLVMKSLVPAILWREQLGWFVKPKVFVQVTFIMPLGLYIIFLVLHDALMAGVC